MSDSERHFTCMRCGGPVAGNDSCCQRCAGDWQSFLAAHRLKYQDLYNIRAEQQPEAKPTTIRMSNGSTIAMDPNESPDEKFEGWTKP